ncbi:TVP38/TMEM64 family protein [Gorillibacterium sp. sgz5001074]|uniref:TVP38/TMEM64 family protein n=1 Tax=Gorillibacterium sp. sgz5001074 TaxID=3446695 RepID=UPI003F672269
MNRSFARNGIRFILPAAVIIVLVIFLLNSRAGHRLSLLNVEELSDYLRSFGVFSVFLGAAIVFIQVIVPFVPFVLVAGANILVFGLYWGFLLNYSMAVLGAIAAFMFARYFGHSRVERFLTRYPAVTGFNKKMEKHGFFYVLMGRLIPVIPSTAISFGAGVTRVRMRDYVIGTIVGKLPIVLLESLIGHDLIHYNQYKGRLFVLCVIFILLLLVGSFFKNKLSGKPAE